MNKTLRISASIFFLLTAISAFCHKQDNQISEIKGVILWNMNNIDSLKINAEAKSTLLKDAEIELIKPNVVVTDKKQSITGDKHNYESLSSYYWPNPNNTSGPYIKIDGRVNPETLDYDRGKINKMSKRCRTLSIAYYISNDDRFYETLVSQLKSWFIAKKTRMNPHMGYSQIIKGKYDNQGQAHGIIDAYALSKVLESIRLVEMKRTLPGSLTKGMKKWFVCFSNWLQNSEQGKIESRQPNNHCPLYYALLTNISFYIGDYDLIEDIMNKYSLEVLCRLIKEDGSQPGELIRTRAYHYSILSLTAIMDYCLMVTKYFPEFYESNKGRIDKGFEFLIQFMDKKEDFPAEEIGNWDFEVALLKKEIKRLEKLSLVGNK